MKKEISLTQSEGNFLDDLKRTFKSSGWTFTEHQVKISSSNEVDAILLNKDGEIDIQNIDLIYEYLGVYMQQNDNWKSEGEIIIYDKVIAAVAEQFEGFDSFMRDENGHEVYKEDGSPSMKKDLLHFNQIGMSIDRGISKGDSIAMLRIIVLIHESTHWITHWVLDPNQVRYDDFKYQTEDEKNFHEGLAQLFTFWSIQAKKNKKMMDMFLWLKNKQSPQYSVYEKISTIDKKTVIKAIEFCRKRNINSWKCLKLIIEIIVCLENKTIEDENIIHIETLIIASEVAAEKIIKMTEAYENLSDYSFRDWISDINKEKFKILIAGKIFGI